MVTTEIQSITAIYSSNFKVTQKGFGILSRIFVILFELYNLIALRGKTYGVGIESDKILHRPVLFCCFLEELMFEIFLLKYYFLKFNLS